MKKFIVALVVLAGEPKVCLLKSFNNEDDADKLRDEFADWACQFSGNKIEISRMPVKNNECVLDFVVKYVRDDNHIFVKVLEMEK